MTREKLVPFKIDETLWKQFGILVDELKKLGIIEKGETRSSLLRDYVKTFTFVNLKKLKPEEFYRRKEEELEVIGR